MGNNRCNNCAHELTEMEIIYVNIPHPKPGRSPVEIAQCPECGQADGFALLCDEPGCKNEATCGWPLPAGKYRSTCGLHYRQHRDKPALSEA